MDKRYDDRERGRLGIARKDQTEVVSKPSGRKLSNMAVDTTRLKRDLNRDIRVNNQADRMVQTSKDDIEETKALLKVVAVTGKRALARDDTLQQARRNSFPIRAKR